MITRNDLRPSVTVPQTTVDALERIGGLNPFGEPMFRLCLAEDRYTKAHGIWNIWPDTATLDDRSGLGINEAQQILSEGQEVIDRMVRTGAPTENIKKVSDLIGEEINALFSEQSRKRPDKTIIGYNEDVPVYQMEGFILEKWKPAHCFGSPEQWDAYTFEGESALGPYPVFGDYELVAGPTPYMPTETQLGEAIRDHLRQLNEKPGSPAGRVKLLLDKMEARRVAKMRDIKNLVESFVKDGTLGKARSTISLGAGRIRNELAKRAGITEHMGN
jgi:hypothetical protein